MDALRPRSPAASPQFSGFSPPARSPETQCYLTTLLAGHQRHPG